MVSANHPLVSIVIPSYKPRHFEIALTSALAQTHPNKEIIVSDDCPTDDIARICEKYPGVHYSRNPEKGPNRNLLRLINLAKGPYIKYLLDDDLLHPLCVSRMVDAFGLADNIKLVFSARDQIDEDNRLISQVRHLSAKSGVTKVEGRQLFRHCILNAVNIVGEFSTAMFRKDDVFDVDGRSIFVNFHGYDITGLTDIATWLALCEQGDAIYFAEPLSYFRIHAGSNTSARASPGYRAAVADWLVFARYAFSHPSLSNEEKLICLRNTQALLKRKLPFIPDLEAEMRAADDMIAALSNTPGERAAPIHQ